MKGLRNAWMWFRTCTLHSPGRAWAFKYDVGQADKISMIGAEGKSMTPHWGNKILFHSSSNSLVSVSDPWRAFWVIKAPFKGLRFATCVAPGTTEYKGHCQVCLAVASGGGQDTVKNGWRKPWLRVSWNGTCFRCSKNRGGTLTRHGAWFGKECGWSVARRRRTAPSSVGIFVGSSTPSIAGVPICPIIGVGVDWKQQGDGLVPTMHWGGLNMLWALLMT